MSPQLESEQLLGHIGPDDDEIEDHLNDSFSPWLDCFTSEDTIFLINTSGDENLQNKIRLLCNDFRAIWPNQLTYLLLIWLLMTLSGLLLEIERLHVLNQLLIKKTLFDK